MSTIQQYCNVSFEKVGIAKRCDMRVFAFLSFRPPNCAVVDDDDDDDAKHARCACTLPSSQRLHK